VANGKPWRNIGLRGRNNLCLARRRDPQLEKAVELALDALKENETVPSKRPSYPVYR